MLEIGRTIISLDVLEKHFLCDLLKCKGACCVEGDSGAPLTKEEAKKIDDIYHIIEGTLPEINKKTIKQHGSSYIDNDGDLVTTLVNNRECAFSFHDNKGILKCSIEKAYFEGYTDFRKPISCHLFPIRITEYKRFDAINYEKLDICKPGRQCGVSEKLPLYKFLKDPLIRKYGKEWYQDLEIAVEHINSSKLS
jgi:hypothetical protein